jgi:uncharacterized protein (DUF433 family)
VPLLTSGEAARYLDVPVSTIRNWTRGYDYPTSTGMSSSPPIVSSVQRAKKGYPSLSFVGVAEALVLAAFRRNGLSLQKIRAALEALEKEIGLPYVLANRSLYTDGAAVLWEFAQKTGDEEVGDLVEPATGQRVFTHVVLDYLQLIHYDDLDWASLVALPAFRPTEVVVDMERGFGRPILARQRVRVEDVWNRFYYGRDSIDEIVGDLEIERADVENILRAAPAARAA